MLADLRLALRSVFRDPLAVSVVVLTLAVGIGANVAIFSLFYGTLLRPLDYPDPEELVTVWHDLTRKDGPADEWASWDNYNDWRTQTETFDELVALGGWQPTLTGHGAARRLEGAVAAHTLFEVLQVSPVLGRGFDLNDDLAQSELVVVVSPALAQEVAGSVDGAIGQSVDLSGQRFSIVGILPEGFQMPVVGRPEAITTLRTDETNSCGRGCVTLRVVGRLAEGATVDEAQSELSAMAARLGQEHPEMKDVGFNVIPLRDRVTGAVERPLLILALAVGCVLLVACANVAGLQLSRGIKRRAEVAVRTALGASRGRLIRQLLTENLFLAALSGALGLVFAAVAIRWARTSEVASLPRLEEVGLNTPVVLFAVALTFAAGLVFGTVPAMRAARGSLSPRLRAGASAVENRRLRSVLVVAEVALAVVLLVGAALLGRSLLELVGQDLGYEPSNVLTARVTLPQSDYPERDQRIAFAEQAVERLDALPGVVSVSHTMALALAGLDGDSSFLIEGEPEPEPGQRPVAWLRPISPEFFRTMQIELIGGRPLETGDSAEAGLVTVVNEAAVARYFDGESPLGKRISFNNPPRWREIVGVVGDTRHFGLSEAARPAAYFPYAQLPIGSLTFVVRTQGDPDDQMSAVRAVFSDLDSNLALAGVGSMERMVSDSSATERFLVWLLAAFAVGALLLAALGLYGVLAYSVDQRRKELGIRLALGAEAGRVRRMVLGEGLALVAAGAMIGLVGALFLSRLLESLLYEVSTRDPLAFAGVPIVLILVAALAAWVPSRRAGGVDLIQSLRYE